MWAQTCPSQPLRKLELHNLTVDPLEVERFLKVPPLSRLEYLSLDTLQSDGEDWIDYEYANLSSILSGHQPALEVLRIVNVEDDTERWPYGLESLQSLDRLHTLHIDLTLLMSPDREPKDHDHSNFLPSSLKHIEITNVTLKNLQERLGWLEAVDEGVTEPLDQSDYEHLKRSRNLIMRPTPWFALESFTLNLDQTQREILGLDDQEEILETLELLKTAAGNAQYRGVGYQVYCRSSKGKGGKKLLVEAPRPIPYVPLQAIATDVLQPGNV
jgi:hypothetical protein